MSVTTKSLIDDRTPVIPTQHADEGARVPDETQGIESPAALASRLERKRIELEHLRARLEETIRARDESHDELDRAMELLRDASIGESSPIMDLMVRRSLRYADASLAQLRLLTVQNQVDRLEFGLRSMECGQGAVGRKTHGGGHWLDA